MYKVSLLPSEYRLIAKAAQKKDQSLIIASLVMILLFVIYFILSVNTTEKRNMLAEIRLQSEALDARIAGYSQLEQFNKDVRSMADKVSKAYGNNPDWDELISLIGNSVPNAIGLTFLDMKLIDGKAECTVQGRTTDLTVLSQWLETLRSLPGIEDVRYKASSKVESELNDSMQFELLMSLQKGEGYRIILEEDVSEADK